MSKKYWLLIVLLLLGCVYVFCFTNWFKPKIIPISCTERPLPSQNPSQPNMVILFGFGGQRYRLSEITVVPLAAWQTNHSVIPLWHLTANSRSAPVEFFQYGQNLPGMKPDFPGASPEPLESNLTYRILVRSGSLRGQCDFQLGGRPPSSGQ